MNNEKSELFGFTDSDYARNLDDRKNTSGYVFMMGSRVVSWSSRKQSIVTLNRSRICSCKFMGLSSYLVEKNS